jgi:chloride channel protein, CIC family
LWAVIVAMGVFIGLSAAALMAVLRFVQHTAWHYAHGTFLEGVQRVSDPHRVAVLIAGGLIGGLSMWLIARAGGWHEAGIDRAGWFTNTKVPLALGSVAAMLSMVLVGLGESLGRERSVRQAGTLIGAKLAELAGLTPEERRVLMALGSAAGMGAIYNMPIGGALFGVEVLLKDLSLRLAMPAIAVGGIATLVSWIFLPNESTYHVVSASLWLPETLWAAIIGPLIGVFAAFHIRLVAAAQRHRAQRDFLLIVPVIAFTIVGLIAIPYPQVLGNGKDVVQLAFTGSIVGSTLLALVLLRPLCAAGCLLAGTPGGLFTPTLTLGALMGSVLGIAWSWWWPGAPLGSFAIIGAGAMVGASSRGPLSAIVMLTELTGRIDPLIIPLALATASATAVSRLFVKDSIYELSA